MSSTVDPATYAFAIIAADGQISDTCLEINELLGALNWVDQSDMLIDQSSVRLKVVVSGGLFDQSPADTLDELLRGLPPVRDVTLVDERGSAAW